MIWKVTWEYHSKGDNWFENEEEFDTEKKARDHAKVLSARPDLWINIHIWRRPPIPQWELVL